ncbi:hypothetical protein ABIA33_006551 [Streptacidiphilus sp. MAP12-16]|uniref:hypothetical protein n=1 Tax=Streptacidiphilus sp. MAP12-16 TaxID=3156300 RepID=UPI00351126A8
MERSDQEQASGCGECARLASEGAAARAAGDRSREVDVRVLTARHEHRAQCRTRAAVS